MYLRHQRNCKLDIIITGMGTVKRAPDRADHQFGTTVTLTPVPDEGWIFQKWSGLDAEELHNNGNGTWSIFTTVDKALTAMFDLKRDNHAYIM